MAGCCYRNRPKSVRNRCVIQVFGGVFVLLRCFLDFSVCVGGFVIGLSQISSCFSSSNRCTIDCFRASLCCCFVYKACSVGMEVCVIGLNQISSFFYSYYLIFTNYYSAVTIISLKIVVVTIYVSWNTIKLTYVALFAVFLKYRVHAIIMNWSLKK